MAKKKKVSSKKKRQKLVREGSRDPAQNRSVFASAAMYKFMGQQAGKNKKDVLYSTKHKSDYRDNKDDGSFFICEKSPIFQTRTGLNSFI